MATAAKPKKRSRLALPRQKGASTATAAVGVERSSAAGLHGSSSQQQQAQASTAVAVAADDGTDISTNNSALGASYDCVGLCSAPTASPAGVLSDSTDSLQTAIVPLAAGVTTAGEDHRSPAAAKPVKGGDHRESQQSVPSAAAGREQMQMKEEEKEEKQPEGRGVERHARGKRPRDPLQTLRQNGHPEVTAAGAGGKGLQQAATTLAVTTSAAAAAVAAAASQVSQLLDGLEPGDNKMECRPPPTGAPASPPTARERAGSSDNQQQRLGSAGKARNDLQHQQPAGRKRLRPVTITTTATVPSGSSRMASLPPAASRRAPAPPSPNRGRTPPPPPPPPPPPVTMTEEESAEDVVMLNDEDVVMLNDDQEAEEKSAGGGSGRSAGGEAGAAEHLRPPGCLPSPEQRERCPVCSCAVWGLSVRARQVHINSCLDGTAAGPSSAVAGGVGGSAGDGVSDRGRGGSGAAPAGRRSSSGAAAPVAKEPKTEYQEHIQMAKALSKSLVEPTRAAAATAEQDEDTEEELARDPAAFRAKEKRLVRALKDLDAKLERLNKERDAALRKLAAHRALGARAGATVSAGAVFSGETCGGEGGGGAPKTAEEVVDIIFPEEHVVTANNRPSTRSEGRRQRRQAAMAEAAAAGAPPPPEAEADPATTVEPRPSTSRRGEDPEETVPPAGARGPGGAPGEPVGAAGKVGSVAASDSPPCGGDECGSGGNHDDGGDDDDDGVGGARLIRRRSSGGGGGGGGSGDGDGRLLSSAARKSEKGKGRRTFWGIAQDADELSQSNFVTGVFADIRAESTAAAAAAAAGGGGGEKQTSKVGTVTAAPYGDASLYNRRARPAPPASSSAGAGAEVTAASTPPPNLSRGLGRTRARGSATATAAEDGGTGSGASGVDETNTPFGDSGEPDDGEGDGSQGGEAVDAVDDAILLLSQTLSAGHPRPGSAAGRVPVQRPKPSASDMPRSSSAAASANERRGTADEQVGEGKEDDTEAERVAARHIAHAPVEAMSRLFPNWKENVRFVFRQGAEELREALRSIDAALSEEEAAVAAAAKASAERENALGGDSGRSEGLSSVRGGSERHPGGDSGGGGGRAGNAGGKAEALLFFEGVILEALDLKGSVVPSQKGLPAPRRYVDGEGGNRSSGGSSTCSDPELDTEAPSGRVGDGCEKAVGDSTDDASRLRDSEYAREEKERDEEERGGRDAGGGGAAAAAGVAEERLPVTGEEVARGEALDVDSQEGSKDGDVAPAVGGAGDGETKESRRGDRGGRDSVETVVLSGDSCCDAVVTFDLTSSEPTKSCPRPASPAAAGDVPTGAPSGAKEPLDCGETEENGGSGSTHRGTTSGVRSDEGEGGDDDDDDFAIMGNGGGAKSGSRAKELGAACEEGKTTGDEDGGGVDEYPVEDDDDDGFVDDYCPWDDHDDFSVFPSPTGGGASDESFGLPSPPLSPTQRPSPQPSPGEGAGDSCGGGGGNSGGGKASCGEASAMDADVLDLTQVAPSPAPSARRCPDGCSEPTAAAAVATVPVRNRPPHRSREISSVRRHRDDAASPPLEEDEDDEEEVVEQGAAAPIPETEAGVSGNEDGLREVMPAFSQMTLQELAGMMAVYGLKKKSKREMTQRLEHIWKTLHPAAAAANAAAAAAAGDGVDTTDSSVVSSSQRRRAAGPGRANAVPTAPSARSQGRPPLPRPTRATGNGGGGSSGRGGASSQRSTRLLDGQHRGEGGEGYYEDDAVPPRAPSSSQNKRPRAVRSGGEEEATASLGVRIRVVITGFAPLHEDILLLRTIELSATQRLLKDKGVKCSKKDLARYLDARGITFVDRGTKRGGEGGGRAAKKKKKKKNQESTGCASDPSGA